MGREAQLFIQGAGAGHREGFHPRAAALGEVSRLPGGSSTRQSGPSLPASPVSQGGAPGLEGSSGQGLSLYHIPPQTTPWIPEGMQDPAPTLSTLSYSAYCPACSSEESGAPSAGVVGVPAFPSLERGGLLDVCCCVCGARGCILRKASLYWS